MNKHYSPHPVIMRSLLCGLALVAAAVLMTPTFAAAAETAANATIINVVKVTYKDAIGAGSFSASASATATVLLKVAMPTVGTPTPGSGQTAISGVAQPYAFPIYSNANGSDAYTLNVGNGASADTSTTVNRYIYSTIDPQGVETLTGNTTTTAFTPTIGASVILSDNNADTVSVPYGSLNGIDPGDYVVINGIVYKVDTTTPGTAPSWDSTNHVVIPGTDATIKLFLQDGITSADFSAVNLTGATISERYVVNVAITGTPGTADLKVDLYPTSTPGLTYTQDNISTTFDTPAVGITKTVSPLSGKPGDFLEYTVTITGALASVTQVTVTDAVPKYTKLVSYPTTYKSGPADGTYTAANFFATIFNGTTTAQITGTAGLDDTNGAGVGYGNAPVETENSPVTFYLGTGSTNAAGGTVATGESYVIKYTVQIL